MENEQLNNQPIETQEPTVDKVKIGDEELTIEEAKRYLSMGRDATKKWQEASEMRKQAEAFLSEMSKYDEYLPAIEAFKTMPPVEQQRIMSMLQGNGQSNLSYGNPVYGQSGMGNAQYPYPQQNDIDISELTDNERRLYIENQRVRQELQEVSKLIKEMSEPYQELSKTRQIEKTAEAAKIMGFEVSSKDIKEMLDNGIGDPLKFLQYRRNFQAPASASQEQIPSTPTTTDRTFDPAQLTADEIVYYLQQGYKPKQ